MERMRREERVNRSEREECRRLVLELRVTHQGSRSLVVTLEVSAVNSMVLVRREKKNTRKEKDGRRERREEKDKRKRGKRKGRANLPEPYNQGTSCICRVQLWK
jgi:hypothetical protein